MKLFDINGSAPARSRIRLVGAGGNIGETEADSNGNWLIRGVAFDGPGDHEVHAEARTPVGHVVHSETISCHVESDEEVAAAAEERERAMALYERTVESFARGSGIDHQTVKEVCMLAGISIEQFTADVQLVRDMDEQDAMIEARLNGSP